jgi:WD40 repeat protein
VLIVLDDVWERSAIEPFLVDSPQSRWLVTTRDGRISTALGATEIKLGTLTDTQALALLRGWNGHDDTKHTEIAAVLDYHPLAIKLVGARMKDVMTGQEWLDSYGSIAQIKLGRRPTRSDESLQLCFDVSIHQLHSDDRPLYHAMGIFPEDEWIPESVVTRLWRKLQPELSVGDCADILVELDKLALIDRETDRHQVRMHDLLHSYNRELLGEQYIAIQVAFVAAHEDLRNLPDEYTYRFIAYHLIESRQVAVLRGLMLDYLYLRAKLGATDANALQADCDLLMKLGEDETIRILRSAISMSAHVLHEDADALGHQLIGRMMGHRKVNAELRAFTDAIPAQQPGLYPVNFDSEYVTHEQAGGHLQRTLAGHTGGVRGATVLKDGRILSWSDDHTLRLWAVDGSSLSVIKGHTDEVKGVLVLTDDCFLSWSKDKTIRLWSIDGRSLTVIQDHIDDVTGVEKLSDTRFLSWGEDSVLRLWSFDGKLLVEMIGHINSIWGVQILSNGSLMSWSKDGTLRLWTVDGDLLAVLEGHTDSVWGALETDDQRILSWGADHTLRLWKIDGTSVAVLKGHSASVDGAELFPDGRLLSWDINGTLRLWAPDGAPLALLKKHKTRLDDVYVIANDRFYSWSGDGVLRLWIIEDLSITITEYNELVGDMIMFDDNNLLSWNLDYTLRLLNLNLETLEVFVGHSNFIDGAQVLDNSRFLSWALDRTLRLWEVGKSIDVLKGHSDTVWGIKQLNYEQFLTWSGNEDAALRLWSVDGMPLVTLIEHIDNIRDVQILSDGRLLLIAENGLKILNVNGEILASLEEHTRPLLGAIQLSDGRFLSWGLDNILKFWDANRTPLSTINGHANIVVGALQFLDGRLLSWSADKTLKLWSSNGDLLTSLEGHTDWVAGAERLADGRILSWGHDNTLRLWTAEGMPLAVLTGHIGHVHGARELTDGHLLSWSSREYNQGDNTLRLWTAVGTLQATLNEPKNGDRDKIKQWIIEQGCDPNEIFDDAENAEGQRIGTDHTNAIVFYYIDNCETIGKFYADADIEAGPIFSSDGTTIAAGDAAGRVLFLRWRDH